jgi:hypothetical protein
MIWTIIWKEYKWTLLGTAGTWLLFDITFYGNGLFKETVLIILGLSGTCSSQLLVAQLLMLMTRRGSC